MLAFSALVHELINLWHIWIVSSLQYNTRKYRDLRTERILSESPAWFAQLYKKHDLIGGHVIKLGGGNDDAAREALSAWPG
jgi:hypothetical protein